MPVTINGEEINRGILRTNDRCRGCNKCLNGCPIFSANVAAWEDGVNKIYVDQRRCILCGRCMDLCTHDARVYMDDTEQFFGDLSVLSTGRRERGISLIVAPAFITNYPTRYRQILGYLKHLGVGHIYSVSAGADITIWGYINYLQQTGKKGMISQPCPAIVGCIEKYHPALLERTMPVQSPMMCLAIYLRKYLGITDDLAFLGPCIAKKEEIERPQNQGYIQYSVTFQNLIRALGGTDISDFSAEDSELEYGLGAMFSMQGGMRENLEYYLGLDVENYVNQKEGETYSYDYLNLYSSKIDYDDPFRAKLVDILNCTRGCNYGTATEFKHTPSNHIPYSMNRVRVQKASLAPLDDQNTPEERLVSLNNRFRDLSLEDFLTTYEDRSVQEPAVSKTTLAAVFKDMLKFTEAEQTMDCSSCGMRSCRDMATAIARGYNYRENCVHFVKKQLVIEQSESLIQKQRLELLQNARDGAQISNVDQLTGLMNRYGFEWNLEKALKRARQSGLSGYVYLIDFDDFKTINESYGPDFGNSLLIEFSRFLEESFGDIAEIHRVGGDEFALLLEATSTLDARQVTNMTLRRAQQAWEIMGVRFYCTASIGVVQFPQADEGVNDIVRHAETAMFKAKMQGKNSSVTYDPNIDSNILEQVTIIRQMRDSIARGFEHFQVHYQPWVSPSGNIIGAEALLRWQDDAGTFISPGTFIPIAENVGLIGSIGEFVLERAAEKCREINAYFPDFVMSVNVSPKQFARAEELFDSFQGILQRTGVDMRNMYLEITESVGLEHNEKRREVFDRFTSLGVNFALDDFGTGYSSLSYLGELPLVLVKIDRAFIRNIETDIYSKHLLTMITELMHKMDRRVCVEGVETEAQLEHCRSFGVDLIQGFHFYRPMPGNELTALLQSAQLKC